VDRPREANSRSKKSNRSRLILGEQRGEGTGTLGESLIRSSIQKTCAQSMFTCRSAKRKFHKEFMYEGQRLINTFSFLQKFMNFHSTHRSRLR
jgi:hypothetical protein